MRPLHKKQETQLSASTVYSRSNRSREVLFQSSFGGSSKTQIPFGNDKQRNLHLRGNSSKCHSFLYFQSQLVCISVPQVCIVIRQFIRIVILSEAKESAFRLGLHEDLLPTLRGETAKDGAPERFLFHRI